MPGQGQVQKRAYKLHRIFFSAASTNKFAVLGSQIHRTQVVCTHIAHVWCHKIITFHKSCLPPRGTSSSAKYLGFVPWLDFGGNTVKKKNLKK